MTDQKSNKPSRMPEFDSMAQCSAATGIPLAALKMAKQNGCDAFRHSRVNLAAFLRWWFAQGQDDENTDWGQELKKAQALRERLKLANDEQRLVDRDEVVFAVNKGMSMYAAIRDRKDRVEGPPALKGRDETFIQGWLVKASQDCNETLRTEIAALERKNDAAD